MANAYKRGKEWWSIYEGEDGKLVHRPTGAQSQSGAQMIAALLEYEARTQTTRPVGPPKFERTIAELCSWWRRAKSQHESSQRPEARRIRQRPQTPDERDCYRQPPATANSRQHFGDYQPVNISPQMAKQLRNLVVRLFKDAGEYGTRSWPSPTKEVPNIKLPTRRPRTLSDKEARTMFSGLPHHWRPLFKTALYTGMRQGELLALERRDVDMTRGEIRVRRGGMGATTKTGRERVIPIVADLKPWLCQALSSSSSELVFPKADGSQRRHATDLTSVLNRALTKRWDHKCRRKDCGLAERREDSERRFCPVCATKLWPVAVHVQRKFKDLRATFVASNLAAGVPLATVRAWVGHDDTSSK